MVVALWYGAKLPSCGDLMQVDQLKRRDFVMLLASAAAYPLAARAQQPGKLPRVGVLEPYAATDPGYRVSQAFHDTGIVEGRDILVEWRYAEGHIERIPALATELAGLKPDALVAIGDVAIRALRAQTATIPIVAATDDLVGEGHAASLSHPGGNVTGISILASELNSKRLEVLKEVVPSATRVVVLWDPATGAFHLPTLRNVAQTLGLELQVHQMTGEENLIKALDAAQAWGADAMNVLASPTLHALRKPIIEQAAARRLPAIYQWGESARGGGLLSYGPFRTEVYQGIARQLARVLKGANPAELPVEQPTRFELVINLKTANVLGLPIPPLLFTRADEVIE
jgi:putative ABC transport system substrate-binding protein